MKIKINPFIHSRSLGPTELLGREPQLRAILNRLATKQSTAIIGLPRIGKTSLLNCIFDEAMRTEMAGSLFQNDLFCMLDAQSLRDVKTQAGFWSRALTPLEKNLQANGTTSAQGIGRAFAVANENQFGSFVLEQLFVELNKTGSKFVLLLDEFDDFLSHPVLNSAEFYGGLRSLASRSQGLTLVVASRHEIEELNVKTQEINPTGSPYFNVFTSLRLGALSQIEFDTMLERSNGCFTKQDGSYIATVSGRHPYLAQATASALWDAHHENKRGVERYSAAGHALQQQTDHYFAETWRFWSNATRKAVTAIAIAEIPRFLGDHEFRVNQLVERLEDFSPELEKLESDGVLMKTVIGEWHITQAAFVWWLTDELRRNVRDDTEFQSWLRSKEIDGMLTKGERDKLSSAVRSALAVAGKGASTLIESLAKGFGEGLTKPVAGVAAKSTP